MTRTRNLLLTGSLLGAGVLLALGMSTDASFANDVRSQLPADIVAQHCLAHGAGSTAEGRFMLPDGQRVTGSITCTDADLKAPAIQVGQADWDDDDDHHPRRGEHGGRHGHPHHDDWDDDRDD